MTGHADFRCGGLEVALENGTKLMFMIVPLGVLPRESEYFGPIGELFSAAVKARSRAYAPYSGFAVGAAVRTESGVIFSGGNVENAAFPVGICAEAAAIAAAKREIANLKAA